MEKVAIVGAGITGACSSLLIHRNLPEATTVTIFDKSRGTGGRMSTSRCPNNQMKAASVDLGAQYFSFTPEYAEKHSELHGELFDNNIITSLNCAVEGDQSPKTTKHYIAPAGSGSVVKYFLKASEADIKFDELVTHVDIENKKVKLVSQSGNTEIADAVILTMPVPQILQLEGSIKTLINSDQSLKLKLEKVSYSSRFAIGMFYNPGTSIPFSWGSKYVTDNPCIRFISIDDKKRGISSSDVGPSVVVHCSVPFSFEHLETDKEEMKSVILQHTLKAFPELPEPVEVKGHKWRYSQINKAFEGSPGCVVLSQEPLIVLAGDAFTHSNMDGCIASAKRVCDEITKLSGKL